MRPPRLIATTLLALIWLGGALAVLQVVLSAGVPSEGAASLIAHASGMAAGYGAAIMLILMSRSPWLERGVSSSSPVPDTITRRDSLRSRDREGGR